VLLGKSKAECKREITRCEFLDWRAFCAIEACGDDGASARLAYGLFRLFVLLRTERVSSVSPSDFMIKPNYRPPTEVTDEEMESKVNAWLMPHGETEIVTESGNE